MEELKCLKKERRKSKITAKEALVKEGIREEIDRDTVQDFSDED